MTFMPAGPFKKAAYGLGNLVAGRHSVSGRPIFLCGNGRSGTSWVGETLGWSEGLLYYREPCHPYRNGIHDDSAANRIWTGYLRPDDRDPFFETQLDRAFAGHFWAGSGYRPRNFLRRLGKRPRILVKEVAAFLAAEWVAARWDPQMVVLFRHPGAYVASVRRMDHPARELARLRLICADAALREDHIHNLAAPLSRIDDPMQASIATWAIRTRVALAALARHPDWLRLHYEDIARDPVPAFRAIYAQLALSWTNQVAEQIRGKTSMQAAGQFSTGRVSQQRIDAWRADLTADEIAGLQRVLDLFELPVYSSPEDWVIL
jgi:hypothetical protein